MDVKHPVRQHCETSAQIFSGFRVLPAERLELHEHYQWPWRGGYGGTFGTIPIPLSADEVLSEQENSESGRRDDPHLRSTRQVTGYHIQVTDGEIGYVEDFMVDDENLAICFLAVAALDRVFRRRMIMKEKNTHQKEKRNGKKNGNL